MSLTNTSLIFLPFYVILLLIHSRIMSIFSHASLTVVTNLVDGQEGLHLLSRGVLRILS